MVLDIASRTSMRIVDGGSGDEDGAAERWHQWQAQNRVSGRKSATQARIAFTVLFAGLGGWVGLQLFNPSFWP